MAKIQANTPQGTRDFGPETLFKRRFIFQHISQTFEKYGYQPIETPAMENLSTLTGKYGEEGDRLIFKILNSGDFLSKLPEDYVDFGSKKLGFAISEKALRYDLTVPFARFVVQHRNELSFPFKRYQIQPVWRADKPQKGRYREFTQCDADVVGSDSLLYEIELMQIFDEVLTKLALSNIVIKINNRKILLGIAQSLGIENRMSTFLIALDKLDKIGEEGVKKELLQKDFDADCIETAFGLLLNDLDNHALLDRLDAYFEGNESGKKGSEELRYILRAIEKIGLKSAEVRLDLSLARGLDYYTGAIFEVVSEGYASGSICGGGRYDNLTDIFGMPNMSGVGISFGADRIYDLMEQLQLFPDQLMTTSQVLITHFGENEIMEGLKIAQILRENNIRTELYPQSDKLKKQFDYAQKKNIQFLLMLGENEVKSGIYILKNQITGEQVSANMEQLLEFLHHKLH